jgi:hypothetical protein
MSVMVSLRDVINEMAEVGDDQTAYLNRRTGEPLTLSDEQRYVMENGHPAADLSDGQRQLREAHESGDLLELPAAFEHHLYSIVERFCQSVRDPDHRAELLRAIRSKRALRDFNEALRRLGIQQQWIGFRNRGLEEIAIHWLDANGIAYNRAA